MAREMTPKHVFPGPKHVIPGLTRNRRKGD